MVVLDTTFIIHLLRGNQKAASKSKELPVPSYTTRLNVFEVLIGVYSKNQFESSRALAILNDLLSSIKVLELDDKSGHLAAKLAAELNKNGQTIATSDILIAAIALANGQDTIVTQNVKHFSRVPGLKVETY